MSPYDTMNHFILIIRDNMNSNNYYKFISNVDKFFSYLIEYKKFFDVSKRNNYIESILYNSVHPHYASYNKKEYTKYILDKIIENINEFKYCHFSNLNNPYKVDFDSKDQLKIKLIEMYNAK